MRLNFEPSATLLWLQVANPLRQFSNGFDWCFAIIVICFLFLDIPGSREPVKSELKHVNPQLKKTELKNLILDALKRNGSLFYYRGEGGNKEERRATEGAGVCAASPTERADNGALRATERAGERAGVGSAIGAVRAKGIALLAGETAAVRAEFAVGGVCVALSRGGMGNQPLPHPPHFHVPPVFPFPN